MLTSAMEKASGHLAFRTRVFRHAWQEARVLDHTSPLESRQCLRFGGPSAPRMSVSCRSERSGLGSLGCRQLSYTQRAPAETAAAATSESQPDNVVPSRNFCDPRRLLFRSWLICN